MFLVLHISCLYRSDLHHSARPSLNIAESKNVFFICFYWFIPYKTTFLYRLQTRRDKRFSKMRCARRLIGKYGKTYRFFPLSLHLSSDLGIPFLAPKSTNNIFQYFPIEIAKVNIRRIHLFRKNSVGCWMCHFPFLSDYWFNRSMLYVLLHTHLHKLLLFVDYVCLVFACAALYVG